MGYNYKETIDTLVNITQINLSFVIDIRLVCAIHFLEFNFSLLVAFNGWFNTEPHVVKLMGNAFLFGSESRKIPPLARFQLSFS